MRISTAKPAASIDKNQAPPAQEPEPRASHRKTLAAVLVLALVCTLFWGDVLLGGRVLLPGAMLRGFAPFGSDAKAPWTILQWDALAQYFPWRDFAGERLRSGHIPLWNPHQFAGAPFAANGQSAVFYPLSLPFWLADTARAFGIAAFVHSLLAALGAFALLQRWNLSVGASVFGALAWSLSGYLSAWSALPTLAHTASWLPLLLWLFERAACRGASRAEPADSTRPQRLRAGLEPKRRGGQQNAAPVAAAPQVLEPKPNHAREGEELAPESWPVPADDGRARRLALFALALCCALLAGHAQIFAFLVLALLWRALTLESPLRALQVLACGGAWAALLAALQLLPTLELARLGHRAGAQPSEGGWSGAQGVAAHALQPSELLALAAPGWPMAWGSLNENFAYVGAVALLLALLGTALSVRRGRSAQAFALGLAVLGLGTALGWAPARWVYFGLPGAAQLAGLGRALVLWSLGTALLGAFGLDALGRRFPQRAQAITLLACALVALELGLNGWAGRVTATREQIYPATELTSWLQKNLKSGERVEFLTPRSSWLPTEGFAGSGRAHPPGVLPPNGAMVYGLDDIGGYDSLSPGAYRKYLSEGEPLNSRGVREVAPLLNGNMALPGASNARLDELNVRYIVALSDDASVAGGERAFESNNCVVWARPLKEGARKSGRNFSPGWREGQYQPQSFRLGAFLSLCALAGLASTMLGRGLRRPA